MNKLNLWILGLFVSLFSMFAGAEGLVTDATAAITAAKADALSVGAAVAASVAALVVVGLVIGIVKKL